MKHRRCVPKAQLKNTSPPKWGELAQAMAEQEMQAAVNADAADAEQHPAAADAADAAEPAPKVKPGGVVP